MSSVIGAKDEKDISLQEWLEAYIGHGKSAKGEISIIDLSLVPPDILFIVVSVISRIIFEALQRYRRQENKVLPTTLVVEEAHNFIKRYDNDVEEISATKLCSQSFERIAKEGRKFGLGLVLSSQRPSELSQTVLSQCNTFLLHRLVNDRDQEMVKKLVPDNLGSILNELPILPTRKAVLLGWAAPIPILVEISEIPDEQRPQSKDPAYWDVWTGKEERKVDWKKITDEWQGITSKSNEGESKNAKK
jgi:DNA helicase HerA-like ATPase